MGGFFTVGNLLTLGIVFLVLILYRSLDKRSRILEKVRKHADKLKDDLSAYVEEREGTVKNLSVDLKVEQQAAAVLMDRIQAINEKMSEKAAAVDLIDERLNAYDASLEELIRMTDRVQENLSRIRDESALVDGAVRRITEAKNALEGLENKLESIEIRFERDNYEALQKSSAEIAADLKSEISDLHAQTETAGRKVAEHRDAIEKIEKARAASLARDMEIVDKTLKTAVEQAALRADRMEEAALVKLKEQARERIEKIKSAEEERMRGFQENARNRLAEIQNLVKTIKDEWRIERQDWESKEKTIREECKKDIMELKTLAIDSKNGITSDLTALEKRLEILKTDTEETIGGQEAQLLKAAEDMKYKALEITGSKLEEYREAQDAEFRQLEALAEDSRKLDGELRRYMQETVSHVKDDFAIFTNESARERQKTAAEFASISENLRIEIKELDEKLAKLKTTAYENVSEKLEDFENEFLTELEKRSVDTDRRLNEWQGSLHARLDLLSEEETAKRLKLEQELSLEMRKELDNRNARILSELEKLKSETSDFEEGIRGQMAAADVSLASYREELDNNLEDSREAAEAAIKTEIGSLNLSIAESIKQNQRELEGKFKETTDYAESRYREIQDILDRSRQLIVEQDNRIASVRTSMDNIHREAEVRRDDIFSRTSDQAKTLEDGIHEAERQIKEFFEQAKLIEHADELKAELGRHIEDLRADIDRVNQQRAEAAQFEAQLLKLRRLEDEVNAKMTRFISEKHRIEQMDADFNRLLQTSKAVEDKLKEVSSSDDLLQHIQLQIRKIGEALADTDERYQRIEKKNQILENTNDGIDKNFKEMQESEKTLKKVNVDLDRITTDINSLRGSIETLAGQSEKARETADQMINLDTTLTGIEERIEKMQTAREWIARAETRLDEINRKVLDNIKLLGEVQRSKGKQPQTDNKGAPSINIRENVVTLSTKGWTVEQIAKNLKLSISEVELILEVAPRE